MSKSMENLGTFLALARSDMGLTLRAVESQTGISNAYLSQLEHGKIRTPAPQYLYKLAELYRLPYELLMELAGHPVPKSETSTLVQTPNTFSARIGSVTKEEEETLIDYLQFIRSKKRRR